MVATNGVNGEHHVNGHSNGSNGVKTFTKAPIKPPPPTKTERGYYGFEGVLPPDVEVAYIKLPAPEDYLEKSRYEGFAPSSQVLPKGHKKRETSRPLPCDMLYERDVAVYMRDGCKTWTDVFRPVGDEKVPAILGFSPYGKTGTGYMYYDTTGPYNCGIDPSSLSDYHKFEAPDPAEWVARGYAVISHDARGSFDSEGHMMRWGPQEALDVHDTVKWISEQPWSNGNVGMSGNSWLGVSQINAASRDPHPALKCIAPWEGHSDHYRDVMCRGGIPQVGFGSWMQGVLVGRGTMEDTAKQVSLHPYMGAYWKTKDIPVHQITIPVYQTASYSSFIHTHGSVKSFREANTENKWLRIHNRQEWADLYIPENTEDLARFFDRYLKGVDNGWERDTPKVRLSLISFTGKDVIERAEPEYPLTRQRLVTYYLDSSTKTISTRKPTHEANASYEGRHLTDCLDFSLTFDKYTEVAGYPCVKLWVSCDEHDDLDIRVQLRKKGKNGQLLHHCNFKSLDGVEQGYDQDVNIFKFLGSTGMLRASHACTYNKKLSTVNEPRYDHDRSEPIPPGTIVPLTIGIWPTGMVFDEGETLVLRIAGHSLVLPEFKELTLKEPIDFNKGRHVIHSGGKYDAHLTLPIIN